MPGIKTTFKVEGEQEYKQALKNIDNGLAVVRAEGKRLQEQFADNQDSMEALAATTDNLDDLVLSLTDKLNLQKAELEKLKAVYGESDDRVMRLTKAVKNTETELLKQERALKDSKSALEKYGDATDDAEDDTKGLGDALNDIGNKFGVSLPEGMTNSLNGMGQVSTKALALVGVFAAVAAAIVKVEEALINLTIEQAEHATQITNLAATMGMTTEEYQEWDYVLGKVGSSAEQAQGDISALAEKAQDAAEGSGEAAELFKKLGVAVKNNDGTFKTQSQLFNETVTALAAMSDATDRNATASKLLGNTGETLIPILNQGAGAIGEMANNAYTLGAVMSGETLTALNGVTSAVADFEAAGEGLKNTISSKMAPAVENFVNAGTTLFTSLSGALENSGIIDIFASLLDIVASLAPLFETLLSLFGGGIPGIDVLLVALGAVNDALTLIVNTIATVIELFIQLVSWFGGTGFDTSKLDVYGANITRVFSAEGATATAATNAYNKYFGTGTTTAGTATIGSTTNNVTVNVTSPKTLSPTEIAKEQTKALRWATQYAR